MKKFFAIFMAATLLLLAGCVSSMNQKKNAIMIAAVLLMVLPIVGLVGTNNLSTAVIILGIAVIMIFISNPKYLPFLWIILAGGGLIQLLGILGRVWLVKSLPMDVIFSSPAIASVEYVFTMDFGFVWMFFVVLLLSRIFEYGQVLQQESDETL